MGTLGSGQATRVVKVAVLSSTQLAANALNQIDFASALAARDSDGRFAHLIGFCFKFSASATATAAQMPSAMPGNLWRGLFQNMRLTVGGRDLIRNLNGAELWQLQKYRDRAAPTGDIIGDLADLDASATVTNAQFTYFFGPSDEDNGWGRESDGGIPILALDLRRDPTAGLYFTVGGTTACQFGGQTFAGVTATTLTACTVYAIVRYDAVPHADAWLAEGFLESRQDFVYQPRDGGFISLLAAAELYNGTNWTGGLTTYSNIQVQQGDDYTERSVTYGDLATEYNVESFNRLPATYAVQLNVTAPEMLPFIRHVNGERRVDMMTGQARLQFVRTNAASFMLAHAYTLQDAAYLQRIADACGVSTDFVVAGANATSVAKQSTYARALPSKLGA